MIGTRALVCGASGFLGRAVAQTLRRQGWAVTGIGRREIPDGLLNDYRQVDLSEADTVRRLLSDIAPSHVLYAVGPSSVQASFRDPEQDLREHLVPWSALLAGLRLMAQPPRLVLVSSAAVYGEPEPLVREDADLRPVSPYGYHKIVQETMLREHTTLFGTPGTIARVFSVFGPGQRKLAVWEIAQRALRGDYSVRGTGSETRDYLYVDDAATALACILVNAPCEGEVINVASGQSRTIRDVTQLLYAELGIEQAPSFDGSALRGAPRYWSADVAKLEALRFAPRIDFREGLRRTADWIRRHA